MSFSLSSLLLFLVAVSVDSMTAGFSYGTQRVHVKPLSLIRHLAKKRPSLMGNWGCKIKQVNIIFTVYLSPEEANRTDLQVLSAKEALLLSLALSLDSILVGMAFSAAAIPPLLLLLSATVFNLVLFLSGFCLGRLLFLALHMDLSWLSGLCLLLLAFRSLT